MSKTISFRGGKVVASVFSATGAEVPFPVFSLPAAYKLISADGSPSGLYAAFTPTSGTTVTINPTGENAITFTNAIAREYLCATDALTGAYFLYATARRKPGTTGDIAAQTVRIWIDDTPDKEFGQFNVEAVTGAGDPVCGFVAFYSPKSGGDTRLNLGSSTNLKVDVAADSDIEIVIVIIGYND